MGMVGFTFGEFDSLENGLYIDPDFSTTSPKTRGEFVEVSGLDGELYIGDNALSNVSRSIPVFLDSVLSDENALTNISNRLERGVWKDLIFSNDNSYVYKAMFTDEFEFSKNIMNYGKTILTYTMKPYKYLKSGLVEIDLKDNLTNPTNRIAKPIIKIEGTGNISLTIGKSELALKGVDGGVIIDSLSQIITTLDGSRGQFNKMTSYPFPTIAPGKQAVLATGEISKCTVIPRWEVIV